MGEDDGEEAAEEMKTKIIRDPGCPTREEVDRHYATHMPFRSCCPICIQGKGKENPHHRSTGKPSGEKPTVGMDYKSFGESVTEDDKRTAIVIRDKSSVTTHAHVVGCKGTGDGSIVSRIVEDIDNMGYTDILLKGDGEPALTQVMEAVKQRRAHSTILVTRQPTIHRVTVRSKRPLTNSWVNLGR